MTGHIFIALAAALICVLLIRLLQRIMLTPVKPGRSSRQYIYIAVKGREPALENHVNGLLWLNDNGVLRCRIIIAGMDLDEETRFVARSLQRDHRCITFIENGEAPEWIRTEN